MLGSGLVSLEVKAATLRAHLKWLEKENRLEAVLARVPPAVATLARNPPLNSTWIDSLKIEPLMIALQELDGTQAVLRMSRDELHAELIAPLRGMISGVLRLFGTSPATVYARLNDMVKTSVRGMDFKFEHTFDRAGIMIVRYDVDREIPHCMFVSCTASLEKVLDLCSVRGRVSDPERVDHATARFRISW
jgi:hypothetical protein